MPRGAPDWFSVVRPTYLEARVVSGAETIDPDEGYDALDVDGRGAILCGQIWWTSAASRKDGQISMKADGENLFNQRCVYLRDHDQFSPVHGPLFLLSYDDDNFYYCVGLTPGITFERNLKVMVINPYGGVEIRFNWRIIYMLAP